MAISIQQIQIQTEQSLIGKGMYILGPWGEEIRNKIDARKISILNPSQYR